MKPPTTFAASAARPGPFLASPPGDKPRLGPSLVALVASRRLDIINVREIAVLDLLRTNTPRRRTVTAIANRLRVPKPCVTRALDRLAELLFAQRGPDPRDKRLTIGHITPTGMAWLDALEGRAAA